MRTFSKSLKVATVAFGMIFNRNCRCFYRLVQPFRHWNTNNSFKCFPSCSVYVKLAWNSVTNHPLCSLIPWSHKAYISFNVITSLLWMKFVYFSTTKRGCQFIHLVIWFSYKNSMRLRVLCNDFCEKITVKPRRESHHWIHFQLARDCHQRNGFLIARSVLRINWPMRISQIIHKKIVTVHYTDHAVTFCDFRKRVHRLMVVLMWQCWKRIF